MLTWPTGQQVALEVQYAPLTVDAWHERHRSYRAAGIVDVWLFGHLRPHLRAATSVAFVDDDTGATPPAAVQLAAVHRAVLDAGLPLLWINPVLELIGYAWEQSSPKHFPYAGRDQRENLILDVPVGAHPYRERALFAAAPLDTFTLDAAGHLVSSHTAHLHSNVERLRSIENDRRRRHAAHEERRELAARERLSLTVNDGPKKPDAPPSAPPGSRPTHAAGPHSCRFGAQLGAHPPCTPTSSRSTKACQRPLPCGPRPSKVSSPTRSTGTPPSTKTSCARTLDRT